MRFKNSGIAGVAYTTLEVNKGIDRAYVDENGHETHGSPAVTFTARRTTAGANDVVLNAAQVKALHTELGKWLKKHVKAKKVSVTMIEGTL